MGMSPFLACPMRKSRPVSVNHGVSNCGTHREARYGMTSFVKRRPTSMSRQYPSHDYCSMSSRSSFTFSTTAASQRYSSCFTSTVRQRWPHVEHCRVRLTVASVAAVRITPFSLWPQIGQSIADLSTKPRPRPGGALQRPHTQPAPCPRLRTRSREVRRRKGPARGGRRILRGSPWPHFRP